MLTQTPFKACPRQPSVEFPSQRRRETYFFALRNATKVILDSHVSAQSLPILKFGLVTEVPIEFANDVFPCHGRKSLSCSRATANAETSHAVFDGG